VFFYKEAAVSNSLWKHYIILAGVAGVVALLVLVASPGVVVLFLLLGLGIVVLAIVLIGIYSRNRAEKAEIFARLLALEAKVDKLLKENGHEV
jgi:uncharacterized membrane protein (DUF485 family)